MGLRTTTMSRRGAKKKAGQLSEEQLDEIREAFSLFDSDASGPLMSVSSRPPCALSASKSRTRSSRRWLLTSTTTVTAPSSAEFLQMMTGKMGEKDTREDIEKVFKLFDDDNTNKISFRNLARVA